MRDDGAKRDSAFMQDQRELAEQEALRALELAGELAEEL